MKIARVFPIKTSMSPADPDAYFGLPNLFIPKYDEIHISVVFTWMIAKAKWLKKQWEYIAPVKIGGPAIDGESENPMKSGMYLKKGITITSRGCPNSCIFCLVKKELIELDEFPEGNIIQDNNFLACTNHHRKKVYSMLRNQKQIEFKGGLESRRITDKIAEELRSLSIKTLWLACDTPQAINPLRKAVNILKKAGFTKNHLYCYCIIGKNIQEEESRLREIYNLGCMPFAQLYRDPQNSIVYSEKWKHFQRLWSRPAIMWARMKGELCKKKILP